MKEDEKAILKAWEKNGIPWIQTIENDEIPSRKQATNQAIIKTILAYQPQNVLDMGCGEGWICRNLFNKGIKCTGIDGVQELIQYASDNGGGNFLTASYEDLIGGDVPLDDSFDLIVFNYSLFGKQNTYDILEYASSILKPKGSILIQTIHPKNKNIQEHDTSKWIREDWNGLNSDFKSFEWYFRTREDWLKVFQHISLVLQKEESIILPESTTPFSIIYHLKNK